MPDLYVPTPNYQPQDWSWLAALPDEFYRGSQQKQQYDLSRAFQNGVPTNPDGSVNYASVLQTLAKGGDIGSIPQLGELAQRQAQLKAAQTLDPMLAGNAGAPVPSMPGNAPAAPTAPAPAGGNGASLGSAPPASAAAVQPARTTPDSAGGQNEHGAPTVGQIVSEKLPPGGNSTAVAANIARALKVNPNTPLSPDQWSMALKYLNGYAQRKGIELPGDGLLARGIRNNNPDNIEAGQFAASQPGYTGPEAKGRFATFDNPQDGLNAAANLLKGYAKQGINTISGIVAKWAPSADGNDVQAYAATVARNLGIDPNQPLNLADPKMRMAIATAMQSVENGQKSRAMTAEFPQQGGGSGNRPIVPQVPLPKGFTDPQQAILAIDREMAKLSTNPSASGQVDALKDWRDRIAASYAPIIARAGESIVDPGTGQTLYQAQGANANNIALQRFLQENPEATSEQIQAFLQSGHAGRSAISMFMNRYLQEHPGATAEEVKHAAQEYTTQTTAQNRFLSGPQGNTIRSLNVVVSHLQTMQDLGNALKNGNIVAFNRIAQTVAEETGSPAPTNFDTAKQIVGAEVIKALGVAGAGTQSERQEAADAFNSARSPAQLNQAISVARRLLIGQLQGLRRQYVAATGLSGDSFDQMLEPQTKQFFGEDSGQGSSTDSSQSGNDKGWTTLPGGYRMRVVQ